MRSILMSFKLHKIGPHFIFIVLLNNFRRIFQFMNRINQLFIGNFGSSTTVTVLSLMEALVEITPSILRNSLFTK